MATTADVSWVVEMEKKSKEINASMEVERWSKRSIYRVPSCIKDLNPKAYKPQVVSLGPYHHGEPHLLPMEEHKHRALLHFLNRSRKPLDELLASLDPSSQKLIDTYEILIGGDTTEWWWRHDKHRFLQLMILDGCFLLEIMRMATGGAGAAEYVFNDPIFSSHGMLYIVPYIRRDMLMLENQIPLLVLHKLLCLDSGKPDLGEDHINRLLLRFCAPAMRAPSMGLGLHPLDVFRKSVISVHHHHRAPAAGAAGRGGYGGDVAASEIVRSAMELNEAGVRFRRNRSGSLREIEFRHGVLTLPTIVVDDSTEYMFLNLMAFERLHVGAGNEVTAYVFFMDNIIDSAKDVSLLHSKGIIQNALGSDKAVAKMFNSLSKDVVLDPDGSLDAVHLDVNAYCRKRWNMWRANLIHTYFQSPWAFMSLAAAVFLLALTVLQTFYTVVPYYKSTNT